eukprot:TRINITY_DN781946_c0_g1_i1.p1 TRINITY_DN781946_c0_g1~~TRINITY_DN781946_c0_g1_i1.p1  ORF type:complete len:303 (-),score=99.91 TRINITY_DN781946_c0_g1_i1:95-1003(-)
MNRIREIERLNDNELKSGYAGTSASWHNDFKSCPWIFIGGLPFKLTEGDIICAFSQWGDIEDIHLIRDEETGKSRGFGFLKYEDPRSGTLAVDNFNGITLLGQTISVDHKDNYEPPKKKKSERDYSDDDEEDVDYAPGHAYKGQKLASEHDLSNGVNPFEVKVVRNEDSNEVDDDLANRDKAIKKRMRKAQRKAIRSQKAKDKAQRKAQRARIREQRREKSTADAVGEDEIELVEGSDIQPDLNIMTWRGRVEPGFVDMERREEELKNSEDICDVCGKRGHTKFDCPVAREHEHVGGMHRRR